MDYFAQNALTNCELVNLEDMLENGTVVNGKLIEKPHKFSTAATIATQIILAVTSSTYGGCTITLTHLAPFVRESFNKFFKKYKNRGFSDEDAEKYAKEDTKIDIIDGVQTFNYQCNSMTNTNGQSPFLSVCMYLGETDEYKEELAMIIEEFLHQRILGMKNEKGAYIAPAFPKLLYILEEDNIHEDSKYWYLTELAAECTAKRMVPDYISEKVMKEYKIDKNGNGQAYPSMGCIQGEHIIKCKVDDNVLTESFEVFWNMFSTKFEVKHQFDDNNPNLYIDLRDVEIYDNKLDKFVPCYRIIRNISNNFQRITFTNGTTLTSTDDHPFEVEGVGVVQAKDLTNQHPIFASSEDGNEIVFVKDKITITEENYSYDVTTASEHFEVDGIYSHNCRSFLTPYINDKGEPQYYGRFNQGVVTINLPHVALSSEGDFDKFWELMEERLELCHRALQARHERISGITSDAAPILWQHGAFARLKPGEPVDKLLHGGYSTISLGYAGLYETVKYMTGVSHTDEEKGLPFAIEILQKLNDKCKEWKAAEDIDYSVYGTPIESVTYKFAKSLKKFPVSEDVNDKDFVSNSYHIPVTEEIDAFSKLDFEGKLQKLSPGGCISYIEMPSANRNVKVIIQLIKFMYDHTMYAEINTKLDFCKKCGFDGEIFIKGDKGKYYFECPQCGNTDETQMNITRRVCGYLSSNGFNQGRLDEIANRVVHLDN